MKTFLITLLAALTFITISAFLPDNLAAAPKAGETQKAEAKGERAPEKPPGQPNKSGKPQETANESKQTPDTAHQWSVSQETGEVILVFLILSIVFEVALAPIFDSSLFMARFEDKGIKTIITVVLAFLVFWSYNLDIFERLLDSMQIQTEASFGGRVVTALLIAGGSGGFHKIFANLGVRMKPEERQEKAVMAKSALAARQAKGKPQQGN